MLLSRHTRQREFKSTLAGAAVWPFAVRAQQPAKPVVGFLQTASPGRADAGFPAAFLDGLKEAGYIEGSNVTIDYRWAEGRVDRLPTLADDLVRQQVTVIVASGGDAPALAAKQATDKIPIVFISGGAPVKAGLVQRLNRPGGNITGLSFLITDLIPKRLELLREVVPSVATVGALVNPNYPAVDLQKRELQEAASAKGVQLHLATAGTEHDIDAAFARLVQQGSNMLLIANDPFFLSNRAQIVALVARYALPASFSSREFVDDGGLLSYGPNLTQIYRLAGSYVGGILDGAKPADLPVLLPTKFELAINLKTAATLGLTIPQSLLATADEVIE